MSRVVRVTLCVLGPPTDVPRVYSSFSAFMWILMELCMTP